MHRARRLFALLQGSVKPDVSAAALPDEAGR